MQFILSESAGRILDLFLSRKFVRFVLFGGSAAVVNLCLGRALYEHSVGILVPYWAAVLIAASAGLLVNFSLNYLFNFSYRGRTAGAQLRTFCVVAVAGTALTSVLSVLTKAALLSTGAAPVLLSAAHTSPDFAAHFFSVGIVTFYSYAAHYYFSFNIGLRGRARQAFPLRTKNIQGCDRSEWQAARQRAALQPVSRSLEQKAR